MKMTPSERRAARRTVTRAHGKPMVCPVCGNDIFIEGPHVCPEGFVAPAPAGTYLTFYGYNALNKCCRGWMLLGWPQVDGKPKLTSDSERGRMHFKCPKCDKEIWFDLSNPDASSVWDVRAQGEPQPPALVGGRISHPHE